MKRTHMFLALAMGAGLLASPVTGLAFQDSHDSHGAPETKAAHDTHGAGGHDEHKVELLHWDIGSALWSIAVFVILLIILRIVAWKPILTGLQSREEFIRKSLADAKHDREEAQRILAEYTAKVEKSRQEATAIVEEGRRDAEEVRKRIQGEAKVEAQAIIERAKREIGLARDDAVKQLHDQAVQLASTMATKVVRRQLSPQDHKAILEESLGELGRLN